ncbi:group II intron maturase-specific domain-containing protein [Corynebacterium freiburgense]
MRLLTVCQWTISIEVRIGWINRYMTGWLGYFQLC